MSNHVVEASHLLVGARVAEGHTVVDATAGNGHDTLLLARLVGISGIVHAFDVQPAALEATRRRLEAENLAPRARLHLLDHAHMARVVAGPVQAVMFNLGYLPGSDKKVVTRPDSTLRALTTALDLLAPGGVISVVTYSGHSGGDVEEQAVASWCRQLPAQYSAAEFLLCNRPNRPPKLWLVYSPVE